ncbi:MAG: carboxypeptidase-like regulatory domain-containing protein [Flavobacteriaceae bacterium]|nr:carboxypeptidase-like regulatory domain-containing protein [Flavobacteriaceae bacterium]
MKQLLTLTLLLFLFRFGFSQNERVTINGKIIFLDTPINNVHIHNITTNYGATSNDKGEFKILVQKNDTLKISHLEYQSKKIIITNEHIKKEILTIELKIMTNYLNTVTIKNHNLTGNLVKDVKDSTNDTITRKHDLIEEMMRLAKMPSYKNIRNTEKPPMNSVDPIGNSGGGASIGIPIKDTESILRRELRLKKSFPDKLISEFGEDYFINELKISKDKIHHFITYCGYRNIHKLYKQNEIMKLIDVLTEESVEYNEIKN